jgi:polyribonucleotide nucleotidyltransferase
VGTVKKLVLYGIFVEIASGVHGLLHISKLGLDREAGETAFDAGFKPGDSLIVRELKGSDSHFLQRPLSAIKGAGVGLITPL